MKRPRDCDVLGLTDPQLAALTGFTRRAVHALAHLREAWCVADPGNAAAVEASIRALLEGHSMRDSRGIAARVLGAGLEYRRQAELLARVGLGAGV